MNPSESIYQDLYYTKYTNLAKSQSYQGLKLLLHDIKFMTMVDYMLIY
jgi:hypothetical protein